ncbi:MAG: matrixin family metalloprotease [Gammaproteobacteria bacterium]|nr:matrixin family metalloprotease [Gammaproteobacteria bacterium]MDG2337761.1 matrixin family metalloprotease [Gammaproteobacteria bacterium]
MPNIQRTVLSVVAFAIATLLSVQISAFELDGSKWPTGETEFYVDMDGIAASGITWNAAFIAALNEWNDATSFNFILRKDNKDPCANDGFSSVDFTNDFCGSEFGENTLAVAVVSFAASILGGPSIVEADIVVHKDEEFNVFDGNLAQVGIEGLDFRRIALHELGHTIGLKHEPEARAIMAPYISNLDRLQPDDIAGAEKLYDGSINCPFTEFAFGSRENALDSSDCTVSELLPGASDTSPIDLYRFSLTNPATLSLSMTSSTLDSVLLIADSNFQIIGFDDKSGGECNSSLTQFLQPGTYFLLANTFDVPLKTECGISGDYKLDAALNSVGINPLGTGTSVSNGSVNATFSGGITSNDGASFSNRFGPDASLDIVGRIDVDPADVGQEGFIVIAAVVDQQILFLNDAGQFVDAAANPGVIIRASNKTLAAVEEIIVVEDLVPAAQGISEILVSFYFGYGLVSSPNDLTYHTAPLNLIISP